MKTSEVLNRAADLIEERGWTQGVDGWPGSPVKPLCMEGALQAALGRPSRADGFRECPAYAAVQRHLGLTSPARLSHTLWWWNDSDETTAERVIEVLRATAVIEAAREDADAELAEWADLYPQLTAVAIEKAVSDAKARILGDHEHHVPTPDSPVAFEAAS